MTEPSDPPFSPAAFAVMSALALQSGMTLGQLAEHLEQPPAVLQATLRLLIEQGHAAEASAPNSSAPDYRPTAKGRSALAAQFDWIKHRISERE